MMRKWLILGLAWLLVACGTRDEVAAATPIPPSHTPAPTVTPIPPTQTPTQVPATIARPPTATYTPTHTLTPTATPIPLPSAHLLFRRDDQLWDWSPTTNEVTLLIEGIYTILQTEGDILFFVREITPDSLFAIHALHLPARNEQEIIRLTSHPRAISLSPNKRWLAVATNPDLYTLTVTVYALYEDATGIIEVEEVYTSQHGRQNSFPLRDLLWISGNEVSWSTGEGIWSVDLIQINPTPQVVILPSTNQFEMYSLASPEAEPSLINTRYIPYQWSPDGRYLLVVEYFFEHGQFRVIDRVIGNSFVLPGLGVGGISDEALWINESQLVYLDLQGEISLWETTTEGEMLMTKIKSTALPGQNNGTFDALWLNPSGQLRFRLNNGDLMVWDIVTGELSLFKELNPTSYVPDIFWSPDGNWILSVASEVILIGLDDQEPIYLDAILGDFWCCYWQWYSYPVEPDTP